jgi:hypothetical protein
MMFSETNLSNSDAIPGCAKPTRAGPAQIVFVFFTILYQLNTLLFGRRIEHKSPINRKFHQVFS